MISGTKGENGATGVQGAVGPVGAQGPAGASAFAPIPSGQTLTGLLGGQFADTLDPSLPMRILVTIQGKLTHTLAKDDVVVSNNPVVLGQCLGGTCVAPADQSLGLQSKCLGSATNPIAAPGTVCIYLTSIRNVGGIEGTVGQENPSSLPNILTGAIGKSGFAVEWIPQGAFATPNADFVSRVEGVWAYTAP